MQHLKTDTLLYLPLGGVGEIGMNLSLYGCNGKWIIVDMGVSFGDETTPGIDVFMADPSWIVSRKKDLLAIILTHGHEDHLGAVAHLWTQLRCPVYATPFTAALLRNKLEEVGLKGSVPLHIVPLKGTVTLEPFIIEYITQTHSILEPNSLLIETHHGRILHTGDWKFDPHPLIGEVSDKSRLKEIGEEGLLALIGDSTNVFNKGHTGSESAVRESFLSLFGQYSGRIAVACFASNVARMESIAVAAAAHGRHVVLAGRSLWRVDKAARECGYLKTLPPFLEEKEAKTLPPDKVLYICTGSQGEPRAALARIASDNHPHIRLNDQDVVIFSSRIIPGNEKEIFRLQNRLASKGIDIITSHDHFVHVSGHPGRDEMKQLYELVKPKIAIPVHGEGRHLLEHADLARACHVKEVMVIGNGDLLRLSPGPAEIIEHISVGKIGIDGTRLISMESSLMRERQRIVQSGSAVITLAMNAIGKIIGEPQVTAPGLLDTDQECDDHTAVLNTVRSTVISLSLLARQNDDVVKDMIKQGVRSHFKQILGKKPFIDIHLIRL
jgi:ribonuclease J